MRAHVRAWRWLIPHLFLGLAGGGLTACAPLKGYVGAELPKEQVAVVSIDTTHIRSATVDGLAFGAAGVSLLPGAHQFQFIVVHGDRPYHCRPYTLVDSYGFDRCQKEREAEIRKGKKDPRTCALSSYTRYRQTCLRDYRDATCEATLTLLPGKEYELATPSSFHTPPTLSAALVSGTFLSKDRQGIPLNSVCRSVGTRTETEDYEATSVW
ncbi:MAG: hypothetical protein FJZ47_02755 [Candidatus Tectomicrobia bacterium]|uniref:Lipoprotein n=1 Tax=Tectimicrobiota bacterium TaxID=2528274 RepID=A0A937VX88_UNCTE|nr:hypothetical protein [Candidatus Tectomicrobia bacterium]